MLIVNIVLGLVLIFQHRLVHVAGGARALGFLRHVHLAVGIQAHQLPTASTNRRPSRDHRGGKPERSRPSSHSKLRLEHDELTNESLRDALAQFVDIQSKHAERMQGHKLQSEKIDALIERLDRLIEVIDGYPHKTFERIDELREKLAGEEGLRVQSRIQHEELKVLVRNWQLLATAVISALAVLLTVYS